MGNFNENTRVQVPAALHLCKLGYTYLSNIEDYEPHTNILTDVFLKSVKRLNPQMSELQCRQLLDTIVNELQDDDLGMKFYNESLSSNSGIKLIDYDNVENNEWHVTTEFTYEDQDSKDNFRPDLTCFVNGMPLAFIEVKKPNNYEGILAERERINKRMRNKCFRRFFNLTQLMIFSNNQEYDNENRVPIQGAFYCCTAKKEAFFNVFREGHKEFVEKYPYKEITEEVEHQVLKHRNCIQIKALSEYKTNRDVNTPTNRLLTSLLSRERFLFLLRYGFVYVNKTVELEDGSKTTQLEKHVMRYQQLFASLAIREKLSQGKKGGVIWHTQGSGKTELAYYCVRLLTDFYAKQKTVVKFYFIVDRLSLMEQACDEFVARGLMVRTADSRDKLMEDITDEISVHNNEGKAEIMVVNIQKFKEDSKKITIKTGYNVHLQRVLFIDEAHRGYDPKGSFLANLLDADRDAIRIALTGTPLLKEERESWRVFGDYIHTYYYDKSIADGYTLKLMREPIKTEYRVKIENIIDKLLGNVDVKKKDIDRKKILEDENYLNALIDYIIDDIRTFRKSQKDDSIGAMVVCVSNPQAREFYRLWDERYQRAIALAEEWEKQLLTSGETMVAQKHPKPLRASLILHDEGDKLERKAYIDEFKKTQAVDVLIVNKMLLTGFDAHRLKKLYLGRKLDGHDLLQALTRVNRPYKEYRYGYVVDFVDIKENFDATNNRYLQELNRTTSDDENIDVPPIGDVIFEDKEEILQKVEEIKSTLFNYTTDNAEEFRKEIDEIENKDALYNLRSVLNEAKAISNQVRVYGDDELKAQIDGIGIGGIPTLITEVTNRIERLNQLTDTDNKADVSAIINIALSEMEFSFRKGTPEELRILVNDLLDRHERVRDEFEANFDHDDDEYVNLSEEFRKYFREKGFEAKDANEVKENIEYLESVMNKIKDINRRNNTLKKKYKGDERTTRIHKRIVEANKKRVKPLISASEYEIVKHLSKAKEKTDTMILYNINILENEASFKQNILAMVGDTFRELNITSTIEDRKEITNLITREYLQQYA